MDTSAFYALLDSRDRYHDAARKVLVDLQAGRVELVCHDHVVGETVALVHAHLGWPVVEAFIDRQLPLAEVTPVGGARFDAAVASFRAAAFGSASLVDTISFLLMRELGVDTAFAFDADFGTAGFRLLS